ncbi:Methyltransferase domain-containing protein [Nocardia farcinica]|uniref:Oxidoreductase (NAD-binding), involved in siderophore biosynthesis n=1 Tax=Nocardia farcinica TaxID=37329 RepID=A0A0H5NFD1_NOCFR|nr:class I SAM-dependent methyltransferase [Nocardia farcinica]SLH08352.1 Oxidoreductase (NAD-binding), involved in siderophore biosynthesis [Mycobacteroides abscessus subsp. abscessus]AXK84297.1 class I SAM-dependent methyltransferase [Nocardia farcinica]MBF6248961.1 class I SAM-dependent methyltransferase [Nocardia farcinica]CRY74595.1 Oxidoreductase (NAD-binding)%2C involved in siderophore biosynthesis [Nocardia farcinica]SIS56931.1 Methyltransferase domain-containing protein [Nocardia farc
MNDYYSPVAEFYDLVPRAHADGEAALRKILSEVDPAAGTVVDIGAGTGRTCRVVAEVLPTAKIFACEPSPAMRAVLTHAVLADEDLRRRVTIVAEPAESMVLPDRISAVIVFGVLGHIGEQDRRALWDRMLPRLAPGAPVLVELLPVTRPTALPPMPLAREQIGDLVYDGTLEAEPIGGDLIRMTSTWRISGDAAPTRVVRNVSEWHTFGIEDLARETGLAGAQLTAQAGVLRAPRR